MWMLFILILVNAAADESGWAYPLRFQVGPVSFNFFLITLTLALLVAVCRGSHYSAQYPTLRNHPLLMPVLSLFALAFVAGIGGLLYNDPSLLEMRQVGFGIRDFMALPLAIFVGYRLIATPLSADRFAKAAIITGIIASICLIAAFQSKAEATGVLRNINDVRTNALIADPAGIACALVLFTMAAGIRLFPLWLAALIAGFCLLGQFSPLHRSGWIACAAGISSILILLPRERRFRSMLVGTLGLLVLGVSLWIGMFVASKWTNTDFTKRMEQRIVSLLPDERRIGQTKAWDTRVGGALRDLQTFAVNPLCGGGFGIQESLAAQSVVQGAHHNAWTDIMAKTGLLGLVPVTLVIGGCIVIGRRMVRERVDRGSILIGALGVITGFFYIVFGLSTWSFNSFRGGVCLGVTFGVLLRCRDMQLTMAQTSEQYLGPQDAPFSDPEPLLSTSL